jgi:hypothetical protein
MTHCPRTGKVTYHSKLEALQAVRKIKVRIRTSSANKRKQWEREPYRCRYCKLWHLTSTTPA